MKLVNRLFLIALLLPLLAWLFCILAVCYLSFVVGCTIHEGFPNPCTAFGRDLSTTAQTLFVFAAWGPVIIGAPMGLTAMAWGIVALIARWRRR